MTTYLTGAHNEAVCSIAHGRKIGLLVQPGNRYDRQVHRYPYWAGDNGVFTKKIGGFSPDKFREMLDRPALLAARSTCLFIVAPDVLTVLPDGTCIGDAAATLEQFPYWASVIRQCPPDRSRAGRYPVALVAQDGLENMLHLVQWDLVDCLFIGGSTEWKLSDGARRCVEEACRRGKLAHMGRVNSSKRMKIAQDMGCHTADGTFLAFGPTKNLPRLLSWLDACEARTMKAKAA